MAIVPSGGGKEGAFSAARDDFVSLAEFDDVIFFEDSVPVGAGIKDAVGSD